MNRRDAYALVAFSGLLALATHSVVRYRWWIVAGYVVVAALVVALAWTARDDRDVSTPRALAWVPSAVLALVGLVHLAVPAFSYLTDAGQLVVRLVLGVGSFVVAGLLLPGRGSSRVLALVAALAAAVLVAALVIVGDPAPAIDVWVILQQAADGMARGQNIYALEWVGSPGIADAFAYLPFTAVLTAPGRWLAGDVRWALALLVLLSALCVGALGRWRRPAVAAAALLLLAPGSSTLVEQAWTEPTVLVGLAVWALLVARDRSWWAVVPLAVALASKQHVVALLPLLAVWPRFGWRRTLVAAGGAGVLMLPWAVVDLPNFWHDTVRTMLDLPPLTFADTLYTLVLNELGVQLPIAVVGLVVGGVLVAAVVTLRRRPVGLAGLLTWCAAVLFAANLVNRQAFYNQFWLVGALLLLAVAASAGALNPARSDQRERRARPASSPADPPGRPSPSAG
jgi:hypothetical protein